MGFGKGGGGGLAREGELLACSGMLWMPGSKRGQIDHAAQAFLERRVGGGGGVDVVDRPGAKSMCRLFVSWWGQLQIGYHWHVLRSGLAGSAWGVAVP